MENDFEHKGENAEAGKPQKKGFRDTSRRLRQGRESHLSHRASLDWRLDQRCVCDRNGFEAEVVAIEELKSTLLKSRTAAALMTDGRENHIEILYDEQIPVSQFYPRDNAPVITLNPRRPKGDLLNLLSRELRRVWQHGRGALINPLLFEPDEAVLVNRAQQADAFMISIRIAWELKLQGENEAWDYLAGSPLADIGRTFEVKASTDFRTLNNGEASRAAYDKFFEDSRTKAHDKRIIHQMLLDETGYIRASGVRPRVTMDLFARLGELPQGRNYLSMKAERMPTDLCYATIEDRSNANFLWFIKFERSFQEKELQMVQESVKLSAEIVDFARWSAQGRRPRPSEPVQ